MRGTKSGRGERRAQRWLKQSGVLYGVTPDARRLLVARLTCRTSALKVFIAPVLFLGAVIIWSADRQWSAPDEQPPLIRYVFSVLIGTLVIMAVTAIVFGEVVACSERRLAAGLAHRVSRSQAVTLRVVLGPVRLTYLATALTLLAGLAVGVVFAHAGWLRWAYPAAFIVAVTLVGLGISRGLRRASIAVDPISLTIDERMRAADVFQATTPLFVLALALSQACASVSAARWLFWSANATFGILVVLFIAASLHKPWEPLPMVLRHRQPKLDAARP